MDCIECPICCGDPKIYTVGGKITGCNHTFCWRCIVYWKNTQKKNGIIPSCPCCRFEFQNIEKIIPPFYQNIAKKKHKKKPNKDKYNAIVLEEIVDNHTETNEFIVDNVYVERKSEEDETKIIKSINTIIISLGLVLIIVGLIFK